MGFKRFGSQHFRRSLRRQRQGQILSAKKLKHLNGTEKRKRANTSDRGCIPARQRNTASKPEVRYAWSEAQLAKLREPSRKKHLLNCFLKCCMNGWVDHFKALVVLACEGCEMFHIGKSKRDNVMSVYRFD